MKVKRILGIISCLIVILTSSIMVFAANSHGELLDKSNPESEKESKIVKDKNGAVEPLANLQVITEEKEIDKIVSERPDVKTIFGEKRNSCRFGDYNRSGKNRRHMERKAISETINGEKSRI